MVGTVVSELRALIAQSYSIGDQLPNEKLLAEQLDVSRGSVREAMGMLATEGVVTRSWGVGTFVAPPRSNTSLSMSAIQSYRDRVRAVGRSVELLDAGYDQVALPEGPAAVFEQSAGTPAWRVVRLFAVDGVPSAHMVEHVPLVVHGVQIDPVGMTTLESDLFDMLDRHLPGIVAHTTTDVEAVAVPSALAAALQVRAGVPVLRTEQVTVDGHGHALAHGITLQRTDVMRMRIAR